MDTPWGVAPEVLSGPPAHRARAGSHFWGESSGPRRKWRSDSTQPTSNSVDEAAHSPRIHHAPVPARRPRRTEPLSGHTLGFRTAFRVQGTVTKRLRGACRMH